MISLYTFIPSEEKNEADILIIKFIYVLIFIKYFLYFN
jgi:hypothetical protein